MAVNLAACVTAFLISFLILPIIIKYSLQKNLVDVPGGRKIHKKITPSLGGIAIFAGFSVASLFWVDSTYWSDVKFIFASLLIVFLIGVRDDLVPFRALHKLFGQIVAVIILSFSSIQINSLFGFLGFYQIPVVLGYFLTGFVVILITNSFNLIDGLDGLAGSIGLVALLAFGIWFFLIGDFVFSLFCFAMIGGLISFLVFNWEPSEIFMGDTGAMVIGMLLALLAIHFMNANYALPDSNPLKFNSTVGSAVCFVIIPLCDTLRIIILRLLKGQSPFSPDKSHVHHAIMRLGVSHSKTTIILASVNGIFILGAFLMRDLGDEVVVPIVLVVSIILSLTLDRMILNKLSAKTTS